MGTNYIRKALTGGADDALDAINGNLLNNGDMAIVTASRIIYFYVLDHDNSTAESSPGIICPDKNYGTKRWILQYLREAGHYAAVLQSVAVTGIADDTWAKSTLDSEYVDTGGNFAGNKFAAPLDGYYFITWAAGVYSSGGGSVITTAQSSLFQGGVELYKGTRHIGPATIYFVSTGAGVTFLTAGQYLELYAKGTTNDASTITILNGAETNMHVVLLTVV